MKDSKNALFVCLIIINVLAVQCLSENDISNNEDEQDEIYLREFEKAVKALDPKINETFECVRGKILEYGLDPIKFPIIPLVFKNNVIESNLLLTGLLFDGLASFELVEAKINPIPLNMYVLLVVKLENIGLIFKKYKGSLRIMDMLQLYGDGSFKANFTKFHLRIKINLKFKSFIPSRGIQIKNTEFEMDLFKTKIDITGLFNDPYMSKLISNQLSRALTGIAEGEKERINSMILNVVNILVDKEINPFLDTKSTFEIISIMNNVNLCVPSKEDINSSIDFIQKYFNTNPDFDIKDYLSLAYDYYNKLM